MRKLLTTAILFLSLAAMNANADQATLKAIEDAGVELTKEQSKAFPKKNCKVTPEQIENGEIPAGCQSLVDAVAALVAGFADNDAAVESILRAASDVHPELAQAFGDAAIIAAPDQVALIASLMTELAPTAAGGTPPGLDVATSVANPNNNIPTSVGGGGSSSPN